MEMFRHHTSRFSALCFLLCSATLSLGLALPAAAQEQLAGAAPTNNTQPINEQAKISGYLERDTGKTFHKLHAAIDATLAGPEIGTTKIGIHAVDVATGEILYSRNADLTMNPASNMKLITGAALLDVLGPNHRFHTHLRALQVEGDTIPGDLYIQGQGESSLVYDDILGWAGRLRQQGIRHIQGDLVIDDLFFAGGYIPPGYDQKNTDASYRPAIGAFSINFNAVTLHITPATNGEPVKVLLDPPNAHIEIINNAQTVTGRTSRVHVAARGDAERTTITISGRLGEAANPVAVRKRIDHPPLFAGSAFRNALEVVGITVDGKVRTGQTPDNARTLFTHSSPPLSNLVATMNKSSNNFMAEQLLLLLGATTTTPSTWEASLEQASAFLQRAGFGPGSYNLLNGSGLYDGNKVSPRQFVQLLRFMRDHRYAPEFLASLSIAGVDGTLLRRLTDTPLAGNMRAKTGTLDHVTALSGYLQTRSGRLIAYSILFNDTQKLSGYYRPHQDAIVKALYEVD